MLPLLYRTLTRPLAPLATAYLAQRRRRGKEHPVRLPERRGFSSQPRPPGPLAWVHAASVGEATAMLVLIERLLQERPGLEILVTTGTVSSAGLLENTLPARARHQFVPVDLPQWIARFLDHWRPDLALWVESELWPNLVLATHARGVKVRIITDDEKSHDLGSDVDRLRAAGIPCKMDVGNAAHMHHKFALFDARRLMNGSFNWTRSASEQNEENLIVTADPVLVAAFTERFEWLWQRTT